MFFFFCCAELFRLLSVFRRDYWYEWVLDCIRGVRGCCSCCVDVYVAPLVQLGKIPPHFSVPTNSRSLAWFTFQRQPTYLATSPHHNVAYALSVTITCIKSFKGYFGYNWDWGVARKNGEYTSYTGELPKGTFAVSGFNDLKKGQK